MATTKITRIKATPGASLNYAKNDKMQKMERCEKDDTYDSLNYIMQDKKGLTYILSDEYIKKMSPYIKIEGDKYVFETISTAINCTLKNADNEFKQTREQMNPKNGNKGVLQYVIHQNFGTDIDPRLANEIGVKFAREYLSDYQVIVGTHINTGLVHNHIEFNATSFKTGKKFNNNRDVVTQIREISDRICAKYGLDILEETRTPKYKLYLDSNGNIRSYEPTERKNEILRKREEGKAAKQADVNSYLNTDSFNNYSIAKENNTAVIKQDIDELLPDANNFDHLITLLRQRGYKVRDKKKDGEYMAHISYTAPGQLKATREERLGEDYTRLSLERRITEYKNIKNSEIQKDENRVSPLYIDSEKYHPNYNISELELIEAVSAVKEKYINSLQVYNTKRTFRADYINITVTDVTINFIQYEKNKTRYIRNCIADDCALLNFLEDINIKTPEELKEAFNGRYKETFDRLMKTDYAKEKLSRMYSDMAEEIKSKKQKENSMPNFSENTTDASSKTTLSAIESNVLTVSTSPEPMVDHRSSNSIARSETIVDISPYQSLCALFDKLIKLTDEIIELVNKAFKPFEFIKKSDNNKLIANKRKERADVYNEIRQNEWLDYNLPNHNGLKRLDGYNLEEADVILLYERGIKLIDTAKHSLNQPSTDEIIKRETDAILREMQQTKQNSQFQTLQKSPKIR